MSVVNLTNLESDQTGTVLSVNAPGRIRHRLLEMGITNGAEVKVLRCAPLGDPIEVCIRGYCLSLRKDEAKGIILATHPSIPLTNAEPERDYVVSDILGGDCVGDALQDKGIQPGLVLRRVEQDARTIAVKWNGSSVRLGSGLARKIIVQEHP